MKYYKVFGITNMIGVGYVKAKDAKEAEDIFWDCESEVDWQSDDFKRSLEVTEVKDLDNEPSFDALNFDEEEESKLKK